MDHETFAKLLKEWRKEAGKSLYEAGQLCCTGAGTFSRWENGHAAPPFAGQVAVLKALGIQYEDASDLLEEADRIVAANPVVIPEFNGLRLPKKDKDED